MCKHSVVYVFDKLNTVKHNNVSQIKNRWKTYRKNNQRHTYTFRFVKRNEKTGEIQMKSEVEHEVKIIMFRLS